MLPSDSDVTVVNVGKSKKSGLTVAVAILLIALNSRLRINQIMLGTPRGILAAINLMLAVSKPCSALI